MNTEYTSIQDLGAILTPTQLVKFVQKAVPDLKLRKSSLELALEKQQWQVAAEQAHSFKSSIGLLSCGNLTASLNLIEAGELGVIEPIEFRESVMIQCQQLIDDLEGYLSENQP